MVTGQQVKESRLLKIGFAEFQGRNRTHDLRNVGQMLQSSGFSWNGVFCTKCPANTAGLDNVIVIQGSICETDF